MSTTTILEIPISKIIPSPTNPRHSFAQDALDELTASIREHGVTEPILVRPLNAEDPSTYYELVSGERRWRAAKSAELETMPCRVRELTDAEALDIQMIENLHRADLHPMDEAAGYKALQDAAAERFEPLTMDGLAARVGKPISYVAQRVKLLDLAELPAKLYREDRINLGHALILARLTPEQQEEGLRVTFDPHGQYRNEKDTAALVAQSVERAAQTNQYSPMAREAAMPAISLRGWVKSHLELDLSKVPWQLDDDELVELAGSCTQCPKRSSNNMALFSELTAGEDRCMDPACFDEKTKTFVLVTLKAAEEKGKPLLKLVSGYSFKLLTYKPKVVKQGQWLAAKKGSCPDVEKGLMTDGPETGSIVTVCINQACTVHPHTVEGQQQERPVSTANQERALLLKRWTLVVEEVYRKVRASAAGDKSNASPFAIEAIIFLLADNVDEEDVCKANGWEVTDQSYEAYRNMLEEKLRAKQSMQSITGVLFDLRYSSYFRVGSFGEDFQPLWNLAKQYGVDVEAIKQQVIAANPELYPPTKKGKKTIPFDLQPVPNRNNSTDDDDDDMESDYSDDYEPIPDVDDTPDGPGGEDKEVEGE